MDPTKQKMQEQDTHFKQEPVSRRMDSDYPVLDENDCWFYQNQLESHLRVSLPDNMNGRLINMLWHLGAQARKYGSEEGG